MPGRLVTPPRRSLCAFALLELLAVVMIIVLLSALTLPGLSAARARGRAGACAAVLRHAGSTMQTFADTHNDYLASTIGASPMHWNAPPATGWDITVGTWAGAFPQDGAWRCREFGYPYQGNARALGWLPAPPASGDTLIVSRSRWREPARLVLAYDIQVDQPDLRFPEARDPTAGDLSDEYYPWPRFEGEPLQLWLPYLGPHQGKYGAVFGDGHVRVDNYALPSAALWIGPPWWRDGTAPR
ncbi:MAG: hypothetical protein AB7Q17_01640 [Phycisphaerae bacterium]